MSKPNLRRLRRKNEVNPKHTQREMSAFFTISKSYFERDSNLSLKELGNSSHDGESPMTDELFYPSLKKQRIVNGIAVDNSSEHAHETTTKHLAARTVERIQQFSANIERDYSQGCNKMDIALNELLEKDESQELRIINKVGTLDVYRNKHEASCSDSNAQSSSQGVPKYTPLELQVLQLKNKYPGMILMIQNAYKYSFFGEDAEIASKILNICATWHHNFLTAIIPVTRLHAHIRRLVEQGYKVGVVNQTETTALKAAGSNRNTPFSRQLAHIYTKATLIGDDVDPLCQEGQCLERDDVSTFIVCISEVAAETHSIGIVAVDPSTGGIIYDYFDDKPERPELEKRLEHLKPAEVLISESVTPNTLSLVKFGSAKVEKLLSSLFDFTSALVKVASFFSDQTISDSASFQSLSDLPPATVVCLAVLLDYLEQFGLQNALRPDGLKSFTSTQFYLQMDANVLRNLEIFSNSNGTLKGSLWWALDHTCTRFGARLLRSWISQPLRNLEELERRQTMVSSLLACNSVLGNKLRGLLTGLPDLERGLTTILHARCSPSSMCTVVQTLCRVRMELQALTHNINSELHSEQLQCLITETIVLLGDCDSFIKNINQEAAREDDKTRFLFDYSKFPDVMERISQIKNVMDAMEDLKVGIARYLGLIRFNYISVSGQEYLIEVSVREKVPHSWRKISGTKTHVRYRSPEVDSLFTELCQLRERLKVDCDAAWVEIVTEFNEHYYSNKKAVKNLATLDVLFSLVQIAKQDGYCKPTLMNSDEAQIDISKGRHPVVPKLFQSSDQFVANDTHLKSSGQCCMTLSGPNMGGKSCYIRQVALIAIMAHIGSYVPAQSAIMTLLDAIYTRMGARDEMFAGRSTLMVELDETSTILQRASRHSLVLMDELGRGTSSCDGAAIAVATLQHLITQVHCLTLFVTHYPAVMQFTQSFPLSAANWHMAFLLQNSEESSTEMLTFLYEVTSGSADKSYGLNVARLANLPVNLLERASDIANQLAVQASTKSVTRRHFKEVYRSNQLL